MTRPDSVRVDRSGHDGPGRIVASTVLAFACVIGQGLLLPEPAMAAAGSACTVENSACTTSGNEPGICQYVWTLDGNWESYGLKCIPSRLYDGGTDGAVAAGGDGRGDGGSEASAGGSPGAVSDGGGGRGGSGSALGGISQTPPATGGGLGGESAGGAVATGGSPATGGAHADDQGTKREDGCNLSGSSSPGLAAVLASMTALGAGALRKRRRGPSILER